MGYTYVVYNTSIEDNEKMFGFCFRNNIPNNIILLLLQHMHYLRTTAILQKLEHDTKGSGRNLKSKSEFIVRAKASHVG